MLNYQRVLLVNLLYLPMAAHGCVPRHVGACEEEHRNGDVADVFSRSMAISIGKIWENDAIYVY